MHVPADYEVVVTRDQKFDVSDGGWVTIPRKPPGTGWQIADASRDRHTVWRRVRTDVAFTQLGKAHGSR
ncbi:hypothetical protein DA075_35655 (plasmid) [Methylobacterium currus]|uniref:Uncharacterized protein n=1 Tax=Methylobacterium currus TaxID=2051553 RepID=A0A2R4WXE1_9HYPH|nr:hypothetical protein DA075_35655 [Methylobacterium currus]